MWISDLKLKNDNDIVTIVISNGSIYTVYTVNWISIIMMATYRTSHLTCLLLYYTIHYIFLIDAALLRLSEVKILYINSGL